MFFLNHCKKSLNTINLKHLFSSSSTAHAAEKPLKPKQKPFYTFVNPNVRNQTFKDRLYVWGYAGTGALGIHIQYI